MNVNSPDDPAGTHARFPAAVEETLAKLPAQPGCYLFKDDRGTVIYVGKARSLRDRVRSYFRSPNGLSLKNSHLVPRIATIDYQILPSENAALLVEFNLIKQYRPKYNIVMRDDKSFLSIRTTNEPYPRIEAVRHRADDGARYFGPYTSSQSVHRTLDLLKRLFPYRTCRLNIQPPRGEHDSTAAATAASGPMPVRATRRGRRGGTKLENGPPQERVLTIAGPQNRACLEYHIHRCTAPCIDAISQQDYGKIIDQAELFLRGKSDQVSAQLERAMDAAAEALDFEQAARLRDQIEAVRRVTERQRVTVVGGHDQDIVGLARAEDEACVELVAVREGRMLGHKQFVMQGTAGQEDGAVLAAFIGQYYLENLRIQDPVSIASQPDSLVAQPDGGARGPDLPEELLLPAEPDDLDELGTILTAQRGRKVTITVPQRGDKLDLVAVAQENARQAAEGRKQRALTDARKALQALDELQAALSLPRLPMRIECYDISNIQGTSTVGSMVVFENGKPKTAAYRRFRIKTVEGSDDFSSLAEMLRRRLKRADLPGTAGVPPALALGDADAPGGAGVPPALRRVSGAQVDAEASARAQPGPDVALLRSTVQADGTFDQGAQDALGPGVGEVSTGDEDTQDTRGPGPSEWTRRPDLMIIDGGKGQLNAVLAVFDELGIRDQPVVGLAKQHEELFLPGRPAPVLLPDGSQALFLVQRVRDEAHRFAITYHRAVRGKRSLESSLDSVPGVGPRRKRDLIRHFGSVKELRNAGVDEIAKLPGIGPKTAVAIKDYLGEG